MECSICGGTKYTDALKKYNKGKPEWCMPRKGTPGHTEILSIIAKPKRKLHQKRILDSAQSKEAIVEEKKSMETSKRKLRSVKERENSKMMAMEDKDAPEMKTPKFYYYQDESVKKEDHYYFLYIKSNKVIRFAQMSEAFNDGKYGNFPTKIESPDEFNLIEQDKFQIIFKIPRKRIDTYAFEVQSTEGLQIGGKKLINTLTQLMNS